MSAQHRSANSRHKHVNCFVCNFNSTCISDGLDLGGIETVNAVVRKNRGLAKGDTLYRAADQFTGIYALSAGSAKLVFTDYLGREVIISLLLPGDMIGFDGIATGRHACSVVALEVSQYCEISSSSLESLYRHQPGFQKNVLIRASEQFDRSIERLAIGQRPAETRLIAFLLDLSRRYQALGYSSEHLTLPLSREEIGNHLGLALETVSRLLAKIEVAAAIKVHGKNVHIVNRRILEELMLKE